MSNLNTIHPQARRECLTRLGTKPGILAFLYLSPQGETFEHVIQKTTLDPNPALPSLMEATRHATQRLQPHVGDGDIHIVRVDFHDLAASSWIYQGHVMCLAFEKSHPIVKSLKRSALGTLRAIHKLHQGPVLHDHV